MSRVDVTVEISTKNRYHTTLPLAIASIANQTYKPKKLVIFDDGDHKDLRNDPVYASLFALLQTKGIGFEVIFGERKGQVLNHQKAIIFADTEWIWRVDDDDVPEANVLEILFSHTKDDKVGAVGGLILTPGHILYASSFPSSKIEHIYSRPNLQWFKFDGIREVDHFNNSFLFRKSAAKHGYCMDLSPVGHREETLFTYGFKQNGYKLILDPKAVTWHLRSPTGGIRSYEHEFFWVHDEKIFRQKLNDFGILKRIKPHKLVVLNCGLGDHYAFKMMLPELKEKYKDHDIILSVCYPEAFLNEDNVEIISIAEANYINPKAEEQSIYRFMIDHNWKDSLVNAFRKQLL